MKNLYRLIKAMHILAIIVAVAMIGLVMTACDPGGGDDDYTAGRLTITGLDAYNGKQVDVYLDDDVLGVIFDGESYTSWQELYITYENTTWTNIATTTITEGSVTVFVWKDDFGGDFFHSYTGNDQGVSFVVRIYDLAEPAQNWETYYSSLMASGTVTASFSSGIGSGAYVPDNKTLLVNGANDIWMYSNNEFGFKFYSTGQIENVRQGEVIEDLWYVIARGTYTASNDRLSYTVNLVSPPYTQATQPSTEYEVSSDGTTLTIRPNGQPESVFTRTTLAIGKLMTPPAAASITALTEKTWETNTSGDNLKWYSFNLPAETRYYAWWKSTGSTSVMIFNSNWELQNTYDSSNDWADGWNHPAEFYNWESSETVYICVAGGGNLDIVYNSANFRPLTTEPTPLTEKVPINGTFNTATTEVWYSLDGIEGTDYYLWWNSNGPIPGGNSAKIKNIRIIDPSTGYEAFNLRSSGSYTADQPIAAKWDDSFRFGAYSQGAPYTGPVYICVEKMTDGEGTFAIQYSTVNIRDFPDSTTPLTVKTLTNGTLSNNGDKVWYSFSAIAGKSYYLWANDANNNNVFNNSNKTGIIIVNVYTSSGLINYANTHSINNISNKSIGITLESNGTVYICIEVDQPSNGGEPTPGTFALMYTTVNIRDLPSAGITPLTQTQWTDGELSADGDKAWYSFNAVAGKEYYFFMEDVNNYSSLSPTKTGNISYALFHESDGLLSPVNYTYYTVTSNGTVYICVEAGQAGTYAIAYNTCDKMAPSNTTPLIAGQWAGDNSEANYSYFWYSFNVTAGQTYYIWYNDSSTPPTDKNGSIYVLEIFDSNTGERLLPDGDTWISWHDYIEANGVNYFTAQSTGPVWIDICIYSSGTFAIAYSTTNTEPAK